MGDPGPMSKQLYEEIKRNVDQDKPLPEWIKRDLASRVRRAQERHRWT